MNQCGYYVPGFGMKLFSPPGPFALGQGLLWLFAPSQKLLEWLWSPFLIPVVIPSQMP